ncbi:hypothetical protein F4X90_07650 [Candidatus Poribacteria bacterium]|nr:hypothetical protein [Candidatus Poribacteria bacterium]
MKIYGTWHAFLVEQLKEQDDVSGYLDAVIEEYQAHENLAIIQLALQYVVEAQGGISELVKKIDIEPRLLSEVLDSTRTPKIDTLRTVLSALGCHPSLASLETVNTPIAVATDGSADAPLDAVNPNHNLD